MTADIELLPLPKWLLEGFTDPTIEILCDYTRANVAHATAAKDAEIEALRAEVATWEGLHSSEVHVRQRWQARAERLAEALALLPDDSGMVEHSPEEGPFMFCCGREVTYDRLHGPICTHDEECWYARMRALRDHDQEEK